MSLNMNKQYRSEIRTLVKASRKTDRDFDLAIKANLREVTRHERAIAQLMKKDSTLARRQIKLNEKLNNRIAILEGRLS